MSPQLITIGSCLSFLIACHYNRLKPVKCLSSTRHNRIDKIVETYLEKTQKEIPESSIDLLKLDQDHPDIKQIIDNQFSSRMLGKTALDSESAISLTEIADRNHQVDLIIYDSYCELLFKLLTVKNGEGTFFLNTASCENWQDFFEIEQERLEISKVVDYYSKFVNFFKSKNKETKFIFINYPFLHHHNQLIQLRTQQLNDIFREHKYLKENTYFVPAIHIPSEYLTDVAHFKYHNNRNFHDDYALIVKIIMEGHFTPLEWQNFVKNKGDNLLDDMKLISPDFKGYRPPTYSLNHNIDNFVRNDLSDYIQKGNNLRGSGDLDEAKSYYFKAIDRCKSNLYQAYQMLGITFEKQREFSQAITYYKSAIEIAANLPCRYWSYCRLGCALSKTNSLEEAIEAYKKAIEVNPSHPQAYHELANLLSKQNLDLAIEVEKKAVELSPHHPEFDFLLKNLIKRKQNKLDLEKYHYKIIPLGCDCLPRVLATRWGLKKTKIEGELSFPFDLSAHPYKSVCELLSSDFKYYLKSDFLETFIHKGDLIVKNKKYNCVFNHEVGDYWVENDFKKFKDRYKRRIESFFSSIESYPILFILRDNLNIYPENLANIIMNKFPNLYFKLLVIHTGINNSNKNLGGVHPHILQHYIPIPYADYKWSAPKHYTSEKGVYFEIEVQNCIKRAIIQNF